MKTRHQGYRMDAQTRHHQQVTVYIHPNIQMKNERGVLSKYVINEDNIALLNYINEKVVDICGVTQDCYVSNLKIEKIPGKKNESYQITADVLVLDPKSTPENPVYKSLPFSITYEKGFQARLKKLARKEIVPSITDISPNLEACISHQANQTREEKTKEVEVQFKKQLTAKRTTQISSLHEHTESTAKQDAKLQQIESSLIIEAKKNSSNEIEDKFSNARIDKIRKEHVQRLTEIQRGIKQLHDETKALVESTNFDTCLAKAREDHAKQAEQNALQVQKSFLIHYLIQNMKYPRTINAAIAAMGSDSKVNTYDFGETVIDESTAAAAILETNQQIIAYLDGKSTTEQLTIMENVFARLKKFQDFDSISQRFSESYPLQASLSLLERVDRTITEQQNPIEEKLGELHSKIEEQQRLIDACNERVEAELSDLTHIKELIKATRLGNAAVVSKNEQAQKIVSDMKDRKETTQDPEIDSSNENIKRLIQNRNKKYAEFLTQLTQPDVTKETANKIAEQIKELDKQTDLLIQKEVAIARCVEKKYQITKEKAEAKRIEGEINKQNAEVERLQKEIDAIDQLRSKPVEKKSQRYEPAPLPKTPIAIIDEKIKELKQKGVEGSTPDSIIAGIEREILSAALDAGRKLHAAEQAVAAKQKEKAGAIKEYTESTLIEIHETLYETLKNQVKYWDENPLRLRGVKIKYTDENGIVKNVRVPTGLGNMMLALHPEDCKPEPRKPFLSRKKTEAHSPSTNTLAPPTADDALKHLTQCTTIAADRLDKKKGGKPMSERSTTTDPGQRGNNDILKMLSTTKLSKDPDPTLIHRLHGAFSEAKTKNVPKSIPKKSFLERIHVRKH